MTPHFHASSVRLPLTVRQAAVYLGVSIQTVYLWVERKQIPHLRVIEPSPFLFPSEENPDGYQKTFKTVWHATLRRGKVRYFRIYDLRSTYATRLSAGGVADEWVTQLLRQGDAKVFKKCSQMKLQMKREALEKLNRHANESGKGSGTVKPN
jgi:excisionase family DNA binding protein